jgi:hypothetical protein
VDSIIVALLGIAIAAGFIAWVRLVPDEQARIRAMIVVWIAMPVIDAVILLARRL